jgi:glutamine synthetase adenylyltransferase
MKPKHAARRQLETITRSVARRPLRDQIFLPEGETVRVLERASAAEERSRDLERELRQVKARAAHEIRALRERNAVQAQRFLVTLRELVDTRAEARAERGLHRLEVVLLQTRCQALGAMCRALMLATGRTRGTELDAQRPTELPPHAQGTA